MKKSSKQEFKNLFANNKKNKEEEKKNKGIKLIKMKH